MVRFEPEIRHTAVRHIATGQPRPVVGGVVLAVWRNVFTC